MTGKPVFRHKKGRAITPNRAPHIPFLLKLRIPVKSGDFVKLVSENPITKKTVFRTFIFKESSATGETGTCAGFQKSGPESNPVN